MTGENDTIKVIDRRRFYLDDDGDIHEREPNERVVHVGHLSEEQGQAEGEEPTPKRSSRNVEGQKRTWWSRLRSKLSGSQDR